MLHLKHLGATKNQLFPKLSVSQQSKQSRDVPFSLFQLIVNPMVHGFKGLNLSDIKLL